MVRQIEKAIRESRPRPEPRDHGRPDPRADAAAHRGAPQGAHQGRAATRARTRKIAVRNVRRDANEHVKKLLKDKMVVRGRRAAREDEVQKLTDKHIAEIDKLVAGQGSRRSWRSDGHADASAWTAPVADASATCRATSRSSWTATAAGRRSASCRAWPATSRASTRCATVRRGLRASAASKCSRCSRSRARTGAGRPRKCRGLMELFVARARRARSPKLHAQRRALPASSATAPRFDTAACAADRAGRGAHRATTRA